MIDQHGRTALFTGREALGELGLRVLRVGHVAAASAAGSVPWPPPPIWLRPNTRPPKPSAARGTLRMSSGPAAPAAAAPAEGGTSQAAAVEAIAGVNAVAGWPGAPRPVHSWELLPERALIGDTHAGRTLYELLVNPLEEAGSALSDTLDAYLDSGGAVESCARELFVHPNTVRYRLKKIAEITGRDPQDPRDAFVLRVAATIGRLAAANPDRFTPAAMTRITDISLN